MMARFLMALCCVTMLAAFVSCDNASRRDEMRELLRQAEKKNSDYVSLASDTSIMKVAEYFISHGNVGERVRASYILGCVYRERNDAPRALNCYMNAIQTAKDNAYTDYKKLSRIYGQMGDLYHHQSSPSLEREAMTKAYDYAMLAKDTIAALMFYGGIDNSYYLENKWDSAMIFAEETHNRFLAIGRKDLAAGTSATFVDVCIKRKDYKRAKRLIDESEMFSGLFKEGKIAKGHEMHYAQKGDYFVGVNKLDSAILCYRELLKSPCMLDHVAAGYGGLMSVYAMLGQTDSVLKYAPLYEQSNDSLNLSRASLEINKMRALYDYTESQKQAFEKAKEAEQYKWALCVAAFAFVVIAVIVFHAHKSRMRRRSEELVIANEKYSQTLYAYNSLSVELASLRNDKDAFIAAKEKEIKTYRRELSLLVDDKSQLESMDVEHDLITHNLVKRFHSHASKGESPASSEWKALDELVKSSIPQLCNLINNSDKQLSNTDIHVCLLIRLHFITTEIATLLGLSKQRISNIKGRLNMVLFDEKGAKTFSCNIQNV